MKRVLLLLTLVMAFGCAPTQTPSMRILFIGNSYTFYNGGLDRILTDMAAQRGTVIECVTSASPGKSLEWHYNQGDARKKIAGSKWDWVVLQDYSTQPINKRELMFEYSRKFEDLIKPTGAKTAFYMTWPRQNEPDKFKIIADAYATIASDLGATVVPAGLAWQRARQGYPDLRLYRTDMSHPTAEASYLNACCFYAILLHDDPRGLPTPLIHDQFDAPRLLPQVLTEYLQKTAWETVTQTPMTFNRPAINLAANAGGYPQ